jgi:hypothetical protein
LTEGAVAVQRWDAIFHASGSNLFIIVLREATTRKSLLQFLQLCYVLMVVCYGQTFQVRFEFRYFFKNLSFRSEIARSKLGSKSIIADISWSWKLKNCFEWVLAGFDAKWPVLSFVVAGLELGIMHPLGELRWLTAQYVKAKRSATVHNVMEQERKEAANVNIVVGPDRKRATIATEAEKSNSRLLP